MGNYRDSSCRDNNLRDTEGWGVGLLGREENKRLYLGRYTDYFIRGSFDYRTYKRDSLFI